MSATAFCFDLDGTVTSEELLPRLARHADLFEEISVLTHATLSGLLPFESSFRLRVRLLREIPIPTAQQIVADVRVFSRLVGFIQAHAEHCYLVTGNLDVWIERLVERIGCHCFCSEAVREGASLLGVRRVLEKGEAISSLRDRYPTIVAVGEGMNDIPMFERADVRIAFCAVHDAPQSLREMADYISFSEDSLCSLLNTLS